MPSDIFDSTIVAFMKNLFLLLFFLQFSKSSFTQNLPVGFPVLEEAARRQQLFDSSGLPISFTVRPIGLTALLPDSLQQQVAKTLVTKNRFLLKALPVFFNQQLVTHHPFSWNDGALIPAKGYQAMISTGMAARWGPVQLQIKPELILAQNREFPGFPTGYNDTLWQLHYNFINQIDLPDRITGGFYARLLPGQSSLTIGSKKIAFGFSTENLWWGPGLRNSLLMSNTAAGFPHLTFHSRQPLTTPIGSFEYQLIAGWLSNSGMLPADTNRLFNGQKLYIAKNNNGRYLNGMVVAWQPRWLRGLYLGATRVFYQYQSNVQRSLDGYLPVLGAFFKSNTVDESTFGRDQMFSLFFRLVLPESGAEVYGEYGRNDHSQNIRDLLMQPEHARAYILGLRKMYHKPRNRALELAAEITQMQVSATSLVRETPTWYLHHQIRQGYTQRGQLIGAGIGPGSNSQSVSVNWISGIHKTGFSFDRVVRNNDFYYQAFTSSRNFSRHWVDYALTFNKTWQTKKLLCSGGLSLVRTLNYQWERDVTNIEARLAISYLPW